MRWLLPDPHFNHPNLVLRGNRPEGYEGLITADWQAKVQPTDVVYCLGDVCMKRAGEAHEQFVMPMPGRKVLVRGNHDKQKDAWYLNHGWDEVHETLMVQVTVTGVVKNVLLSHFPQPDVHNGPRFDLNLHGHFHNDTHRMMEPGMVAIRSPKHRLLALECLNYGMTSLQDFVEGKVHQPGLPRYEDLLGQ